MLYEIMGIQTLSIQICLAWALIYGIFHGIYYILAKLVALVSGRALDTNLTTVILQLVWWSCIIHSVLGFKFWEY